MSYELDRIRSDLRDKADRHEVTNIDRRVSNAISEAHKVRRELTNQHNDMNELFLRKFEEMEQRMQSMEDELRGYRTSAEA